MDVFKIAQVIYLKFVANDGGTSILDFKFSPASVIATRYPGISTDPGYPRIPGIT